MRKYADRKIIRSRSKKYALDFGKKGGNMRASCGKMRKMHKNAGKRDAAEVCKKNADRIIPPPQAGTHSPETGWGDSIKTSTSPPPRPVGGLLMKINFSMRGHTGGSGAGGRSRSRRCHSPTRTPGPARAGGALRGEGGDWAVRVKKTCMERIQGKRETKRFECCFDNFCVFFV